MEEVKQVEESVSDVERIYGLLSYVFFFGILIYKAKKDSEFVQVHAKQGIVLFVLSLVNFILMAIPFIGWLLIPILNIAVFIFFVMGANNALTGKKSVLPIVGQFSSIIK